MLLLDCSHIFSRPLIRYASNGSKLAVVTNAVDQINFVVGDPSASAAGVINVSLSLLMY